MKLWAWRCWLAGQHRYTGWDSIVYGLRDRCDRCGQLRKDIKW